LRRKIFTGLNKAPYGLASKFSGGKHGKLEWKESKVLRSEPIERTSHNTYYSMGLHREEVTRWSIELFPLPLRKKSSSRERHKTYYEKFFESPPYGAPSNSKHFAFPWFSRKIWSDLTCSL